MSILPNPLPSYQRLKRLIALFIHSPVFRPALILFAMILCYLYAENWLQTHIATDQGRAITAIEHRDEQQFAKQLTRVGLFFLLLTLVVVTGHFLEDHLKLLLRRGLTEYLIQA